jgi:glutamine---fructose-6-phosphate transaminase (isomerizing)
MCGILGLVAAEHARVSQAELERTFRRLLILSESRGKEASGIAMRNGGSIYVLKRAMPASSLIRTTDYANVWRHVPRAVIGHSRLVTNGSQSEHANNQPVIAGGMVGVHNGIIVNVDELWREFPALERKAEVDTEVLLSLIRHYQREAGSLVEGVRRAFAKVYGVTNVAVLPTDFDQLVLATNNGSLYTATDGSIFAFASEEFVLRELFEHVDRVASGNGVLVGDDLRAETFSLSDRVPVRERNGADRNVVDLGALPVNVARRDPPLPRPPSWFTDEFERARERIAKLRRCTRCVLPETHPFLDFDRDGVCAYCRTHQRLQFKGKESLERELAPYRKRGRPDCVVPLSGGRDSCYALHLIVNELGLNPIAYTYDWGMVTDLARRNASRLCGKLGVEHIIVSADITKKREYIRKNVLAWMKKPDLGTIPLFMAGDKQFFFYAERLKQRTGTELVIFSMNPLERTDFKHGFCGISGGGHEGMFYRLPMLKNAQIALYYAKAYLQNPAYLNSSLADTAFAYFAYYLMKHDYMLFYDYLPWEEQTVEKTLRSTYDWEMSPDTKSSWRIGDGTASFYNYIYFIAAGFSENDTFRSFQIREGAIDRKTALERIDDENRPRWESMSWYCDTIGIDLLTSVRTINAMKRLYS